MPAGLSSSTLNLKFMQRAAARTPTSAPSTPGPSTSTPVKPDVTPTVSTPQPDGTDTPTIASEEPYRWKLDKPPRPAPSAMLIPASVGPRFETSYMPFMDQEPATEAGPSRSRNGGGGRMTFGFVEPEQEDVDEDLHDGDENVTNQEDDDVVINVRESGKETKKHGRAQPSSSSRGFLRPRSRSPPPRRTDSLLPSDSKPTKPTTSASTTSANKRNHDARPGKATDRRPVPEVKHEPLASSNQPSATTSGSTKNRPVNIEVKQEPSAQSSLRAQHRKDLESKNKKKRKQSQTSHATDHASTPVSASQNEKKPRLEPSLLNEHPSQSSQPNSAGRSTPITAGSTVTSSVSSPTKAGGTLDERENALKAQRQKEKRARKKAKRAAEKAE